MIARLTLLSRCLLAALLTVLLFMGITAHAQTTRATAPAQTAFAPPPPGDDDPPPPVNLALPVNQSVPATMTAGTAYTVSVNMKNTGTTAWISAASYRLGSRNPVDNGTWGPSRVQLPWDVVPGGQGAFSFQVTAPSTPGSYNFQWGMVQDGVEWFGTPSTNVVVNVVAAPSMNGAQALGMSVPALTQGQSATISVTMQNTGTTTWPAGSNYKLGSKNPDENTIWGVQRVDLANDVAPGQQYTFTFPITAPAAGTYTMQWQMMQRYVEWFGGIASSSVTVGASGDIVTYIHTDALGSPVARTDSAGTVISRTSYEPYGRTAGGVTPTIGFTGHVNDADTGLVYMQQRYYDPVAGRFLSIDPVVTDANTGGSFNRYAYANNSPYKYVDPDGRNPYLLRLSYAAGYEAATALGAPILGAAIATVIWNAVHSDESASPAVGQGSNSGNGPKPGEVIQAPGNKPPFVGAPGTAVQGGTGSRSYGPDGYPETDRDTPHPDEAGVGSGDHSHDWGRPPGGGPPTHNDRGPPRTPKPGDPPPPRGPNTPPKDPPKPPPKE